MARRRWYRRYPRVVAAKKKWATHFLSLNDVSTGTVLVANSTESDTPTPVILKTGNFKVQGDVVVQTTTQFSSGARFVVYIAYTPEGYTGTDIYEKHPEWILGWTVVDLAVMNTTNTTFGTNKYSISSRLKRNLNSGDSIQLYYFNDLNPSFTIRLNANAQFWTCAN